MGSTELMAWDRPPSLALLSTQLAQNKNIREQFKENIFTLKIKAILEAPPKIDGGKLKLSLFSKFLFYNSIHLPEQGVGAPLAQREGLTPHTTLPSLLQ